MAAQGAVASSSTMDVECPPPPFADVSGKAEQVGDPGATAKVKIGGKISSASTLDLRFATVTVSALLREQGGDKLVRAGGGSPRLPLALRPRPGAKSTAAVFETASGARPSLQVEIKQRDPNRGELEFSVTVDRASIPRAPNGCAPGAATPFSCRRVS